MFRGQQDPPRRKEQLFLIGQKAQPAYHDGDTERLTFTFRAIGEKEDLFHKLARDFVASPMHQGRPTFDELMAQYRRTTVPERVRLGQLLIYGLQYQNCRREVSRWRRYMFVVSATMCDRVALNYALARLPAAGYVLEYAPPCHGSFYSRVSDVVRGFEDIRLGYIYPDRDSEVFVKYAMFPHYLLGYSLVHKVVGEGPVYETVYVPNPWYDERGATLRTPPDLSAEQRELMEETRREVAWMFHDGQDWRSMCRPEGEDDISTPRRPSTR